MAKMAKKVQTDYTTSGHDISEASVPYYQNAMRNMDNYLSDPTQYIDKYQKYYENAATNSDLIRDYNRAMTNKTAANYAATGGGYSSSGQRAYNDAQRYFNDRVARSQQEAMNSATSAAQNWFNSNMSGAKTYDTAYQQGKEYSDIEQYNNIADQNNAFGNQAKAVGGKALSTIGKGLSFVPGWGQAVGLAMQGIGGALESGVIDPSSALGTTSASTNQSNKSMFEGEDSKLASGLQDYWNSGGRSKVIDWLRPKSQVSTGSSD